VALFDSGKPAAGRFGIFIILLDFHLYLSLSIDRKRWVTFFAVSVYLTEHLDSSRVYR
jgi:hypothetical protein